MHISLLVPAESTFGEDVGPRAGPACECAGDHFLGVSQPVGRGRINPVDAETKRAMNRRD